jgi:proteasome beta subunit
MEDTNKLMKTGTTTLGLICKDGIVIAADKRATAGNFIADKSAEKVFQIDDSMALTIAGLVSDAQLLVKYVKAEIKLKKLRTNQTMKVREAANLLASFTYANIRRMSMVPGIVAFLIAGRDEEGYHLYNIGVDGSITEEKDYSSEGSGSVFAYGLLETVYKKDMTLDETTKLALKALNAAMQRDSASGSGYDLLTITKDGVKRSPSKEVRAKIEI